MNLQKLFAVCILLILAVPALAQSDPVSRAGNKPVEPFQLIGNIYYVGASEVTSFLITTPQGLILLDGGFAETAPMIQKNIEHLGFKVSDIHILLNSHAHLDHAGGLAALKQLTGAKMMASAGDKPLLESGGHNDPQFGDRLVFPPVQVDQVVKDGEAVELGGVVLHAVLTPGHTPGCTTWTMQVQERTRTYDVVFLCSTTAPAGYQLVNNKAYPQIVTDYVHTFARLGTLPCDVFLAAHGSFFHLQDKTDRLKAGSVLNPFVDPPEYQRFLAQSEQAFRQKLQEQTRAASVK
ncbi:MAG TPA: subclass B3 metallo-beta-lactamase [Candidatus Angelobacter sp.]